MVWKGNMMELALLRTLISREFYEGNKSIAKERIFRSKETRAIKNTIDLAMVDYEDEIGVGDVEALFFSSNQALTTAQKDIYTSLFNILAPAAVPLTVSVTEDVDKDSASAALIPVSDIPVALPSATKFCQDFPNAQ